MSAESGRKDCNFQQLWLWGQERVAVSAGRAGSLPPASEWVGGLWGDEGFLKDTASPQSSAGGGGPVCGSQPHCGERCPKATLPGFKCHLLH